VLCGLEGFGYGGEGGRVLNSSLMRRGGNSCSGSGEEGEEVRRIERGKKSAVWRRLCRPGIVEQSGKGLR
jgi:hypothetical protein